MMFAPISLGLVLLPFVSAAVHDVQVGGAGGKLEYSPEAISAQPGDQVVFHFTAKNHTVSQSSFANPCGLKDGGFDSGFMPVPVNQTDNLPTYTITVNDTQPVWVYCRQAGKTPASHCGQGMVFAVNCGLDGAPNSFTNFKQSALAVGASLSAAAAASSTDAAPAAQWTTAAYGGYTIPAAPQVTPVTQTVTLGDQVWTTTYNSYPGSPAPTPASAEGTVHRVIVGGPGKLAFDPPSISAQPRDTVVFEFHQKNHTVTQSSFADPCRKLASGGFDSDFVPVADSVTADFPTWSITVNDTAPIWAYCRQKTPVSHCGAAMVFAINAVENSDRNFTAFQNVAKAINGTAAAQSAAPTSTSPAGNGAVSVRMGGAGFALAVAAVVAAFL
jgi:plastocyanin